ncbi:hypothetical protein EJ08DRAFT_160831 [Tothia fuscella]|uniref:Uncharacterized protein n=1 Tax=Tothia fuscella TaxID=1048955 RepID=A0A9P4NVL2_9PEZI|nr:hypothetical protein EJ08DRAFT_160831 [Tothia fuscella]
MRNSCANVLLIRTLLSQTGDGPPPIQELEPRHIPPEQERLWEDFRRLQEQQRQEAMTSPPLERHAIGVKTVRDLLAIISKHCEQLGISHEQLPDLAPIHPSSSSFGSTAYSVRSDSSIKALNPAELVSCKATG